jgi:hypothetical protein
MMREGCQHRGYNCLKNDVKQIFFGKNCVFGAVFCLFLGENSALLRLFFEKRNIPSQYLLVFEKNY